MMTKMYMCVQLAEDYASKATKIGLKVNYEEAYVSYMDRCVNRTYESIIQSWRLEFKIPIKEPLPK